MARIVSSVVVLAASAGFASAQGLGAYIPPAGGAPRAFIGAGPIPGTFSPNVPPAAIVPRGGFALPGVGFGGYPGVGFGYPGVGFGYPGVGFGYPGVGFGGGYYGNPYAGYGPSTSTSLYPPATPVAAPTAPPPALSAAKTATLTVRLPAVGDLWVDGRQLPGPAAEFTVASDPLALGAAHKFRVRGEWTVDGTTYESDRNVTVEAGDRSKLTIVAGTAVSPRP